MKFKFIDSLPEDSDKEDREKSLKFIEENRLQMPMGIGEWDRKMLAKRFIDLFF